MGPKISIGVPVYNGQGHLAQALDSLLAQNFSDFELLISDNGSTDQTQGICREYALKDPRVKYYRNETNQGPYWNFNHVFHLASADYFMWAAHDDYWEPFYLQACLEILDRSETVVLAGTSCDCISAESSQIILTDRGVTTLGLKAAARFKRYKLALHTGRNINALFYGIYRRGVLTQAMPLQNVLCADHLLLAALSLSGEFVTSEKKLMKKRWGGMSASFKAAAQRMGITNPLMARAAYLVREGMLQRMIFTADGLSFLDKIRLSCWSWGNYLFLTLRLRYRDVRDLIKKLI